MTVNFGNHQLWLYRVPWWMNARRPRFWRLKDGWRVEALCVVFMVGRKREAALKAEAQLAQAVVPPATNAWQHYLTCHACFRQENPEGPTTVVVQQAKKGLVRR